MKVLVVCQYFAPENFRINELVAGLVERGHQVTVLTGQPNYPGGRFFEGYGWFGPRFERFIVTGSGELAGALAVLAAEEGLPAVEFLGKVSRETYLRIIGEAQVGLALKLRSGGLADTTFPSKVIEIASTGMLLLTTKISDVPQLFGDDGAVYLDDETPAGLAALFKNLASDRAALSRIAAQGQHRIRECCSSVRVGESLKNFFFGAVSEGGSPLSEIQKP